MEQAIKMNLDAVCITEHSSLLDPSVIEGVKAPPNFVRNDIDGMSTYLSLSLYIVDCFQILVSTVFVWGQDWLV